jgi:hypothetical protein
VGRCASQLSRGDTLIREGAKAIILGQSALWKEGYQAVCMYSRACQFHGSSSDSQAQKPCVLAQKIPWCVCSVPAAVGSLASLSLGMDWGLLPFSQGYSAPAKGLSHSRGRFNAKAMMMMVCRPALADKAHRGFSHRRMAEGTHTHTHRLTRQRKPFPSIFRQQQVCAGFGTAGATTIPCLV